jgi:hypothetical protein
MIEDSAAKEFWPDSPGFLVAQGVAALLGIAGGLAALSGSPPTYACQTLMISSSISARPFVRRPTLCARVSLGAR